MQYLQLNINIFHALQASQQLALFLSVINKYLIALSFIPARFISKITLKDCCVKEQIALQKKQRLHLFASTPQA
jgi:hypothetical protein